MQIPVIKKLVEMYPLEKLVAEEAAFEEGTDPGIDIEGKDEGEQFTHVIAAVWILTKMEADGDDFKAALRAYTQKVRQSIS